MDKYDDMTDEELLAIVMPGDYEQAFQKRLRAALDDKARLGKLREEDAIEAALNAAKIGELIRQKALLELTVKDLEDRLKGV